MDTRYIIVAGNLNEGFKFYGPYDDFDDADEASREIEGLTWISQLEAA